MECNARIRHDLPTLTKAGTTSDVTPQWKLKEHEFVITNGTNNGNNASNGWTWSRAAVSVAGSLATIAVAAAGAVKVSAVCATTVACCGIGGAVHCVEIMAGYEGPGRVGDNGMPMPRAIQHSGGRIRELEY